MNSKTLIRVVLLTLTLMGCQSVNSEPVTAPALTLETGTVPSEPGIAPTITVDTGIMPSPITQDQTLSIENPYAPSAGDDYLIISQATIVSVEWKNSENSNEGALILKGYLPTPCHQLRLNFLPLTPEKRLDVDAYGVSSPDQVCAQMIQEFEAEVTLTALGQGNYVLFANGQKMLEFTISFQELLPSPNAEFTSIVQEILSHPQEYVDAKVEIIGYYRGWNLLGEASGQSPVTRSDWVIKDNSGAIYVSARGSRLAEVGIIPGSQDETTKKLRVVGSVRLTSTGQPYIEPEQIELISTTITPAPSSAFYYYLAGAKVPLTPATDWVFIKFTESDPLARAAWLKSHSEYLMPGENMVELPSPGSVLVPLRQVSTPEKLNEVLALLRQDTLSISQANPVFDAGGTLMIITDEFFAFFPQDYTEQQVLDLCASYGVELVEPLADMGNAYLLRVDKGAAFDGLQMANLFQEMNAGISAEPNFIRLIPR